MSTPINEQDYSRFLKLADLLVKNKEMRSKNSPGTKDEISIYSSDEYVSLQLSGFVPKEELIKIFSK